jgi:hypothetical protein
MLEPALSSDCGFYRVFFENADTVTLPQIWVGLCVKTANISSAESTDQFLQPPRFAK